MALHSGLEIGVVTKSRLIVRDVPVLKKIAENNKLSICVTVTTLKTELARVLEPRAPRPDLRLEAVGMLVESGLRAGVNCAPVLPGITDSPSDLENLVRAASRVGAAFVWANPLFLKPCAEKIFMPFLQEKFPHLVPMYKARYGAHAYLPQEYGEKISMLIKKYCEKYGIQAERRKMVGAVVTKNVHEQLGLFSA